MSPVSIRPEVVQQQQSPWAQLFLQALQHGQELDLQRQQLKRQQEQFEFQKKLAGPQQEALQLENLKRKRDLQTAQEDQDAQGRALTIYTGMLTQGRVAPDQWATELQHANDPLVHKWLTHYRDEAIKSVTAETTLQNLQTQGHNMQLQGQGLQQNLDEDRKIHDVLTRFSARAWNRNTAQRAIGEVVAINPQKAGQVATALNSLLPDYQVVINDDGTVGYAPKTPGEAPATGIKPKRPTDEQGKLADYAVRTLEANATMTGLERQRPGIGQVVDLKLRGVRTVEQIPAMGRAGATMLLPGAFKGMSREERRYANARIDLANALLRRASGAQINMEELDRETTPYVPIGGEDEATVADKQARRLQRGLGFVEASASAFNANRLSPGARAYLLQSVVPIQAPQTFPDNPYPKP